MGDIEKTGEDASATGPETAEAEPATIPPEGKEEPTETTPSEGAPAETDPSATEPKDPEPNEAAASEEAPKEAAASEEAPKEAAASEEAPKDAAAKKAAPAKKDPTASTKGGVSDATPTTSLWPAEYVTACKDFEEPERPPSSMPDFEEVFQKTHELLDACLAKIEERKQALTVMAYRVDNVDKDINAYSKYTDTLNKFLVNYERTIPTYYKKICEKLPRFGDYAVALEYYKGESPGGLTRESFQDVSEVVRDNLYATGMNMRTQNTVVRDVNSRNVDRTEIIESQANKYPGWFDVFNTELENLKRLAEKILKYKSLLNFWRTGETIPPDPLDLTDFNKRDPLAKPNTSTEESDDEPNLTRSTKPSPKNPQVSARGKGPGKTSAPSKAVVRQ